jgi:ABC-2 type transport system permease protein
MARMNQAGVSQTGLANPIRQRIQLAAIARVRWQVFAHSIRTKGGALEFASRIFVSLLLTFGGLAGAFGLGAGARAFVREGRVEWIAILLWSVFVFWLLFPIMGSVFTETLDLSDLLRFPLTYRSYFLVRLAYGAFDPSTLLGSCWLIGIAIGIGLGDPRLFPWAALVLLLFGLLNICIMQTFLSWVERWLAQRRTREIFSIIFFLLMISLQLVGPLAGRFGGTVGPNLRLVGHQLTPVQRASPPGLAALSIASAANQRPWISLAAVAVLLAYGVLVLLIMGRRVRAQYRGENLSEAPAASEPGAITLVKPGWNLPWLSPAVGAVLEKELRYLGRSGPMMLTLITPVIMLAVFGLGPARNGAFLKRSPDLSYPMGAGYALILLTNLIYNNFGADGGGIQFYLASPVRLRSVILGKNLAHLTILLGELVLIWVSVSLMFGPPGFSITITTLAAVLFALPVNLAVGNLLSIYSPKRVDFGTFGRQRASQITVLLSLAMQVLVIGCCVVIIFAARASHKPLAAIPIFLLLAAAALGFYRWTLGQTERLALDRREILTAELCRIQ